MGRYNSTTGKINHSYLTSFLSKLKILAMKNILRFLILTWISILPNLFVNAQTNESEPNNSFQTSTSIILASNTISVSGSINPVNDLDYYKFSIPRAGIIKYSIIDVPSNIAMRMDIFDANQVLIPSSFVYGNDGESLFAEIKVCQGGSYYIRLYDDNGRWGGGRANTLLYSLTVGFDSTDVNECNDVLQQATTMNLNTPISGAIRTNGDYDFYKFNIPRSGMITYKIANVPSNIAMRMDIFDANQVLIPSSFVYGNDGQNFSAEVKVCQGGLYYIRLYDDIGRWGGGRANPQLYSLTVGFDSTDVHECNDNLQQATAVSLNTPISGAIRTVGDYDFYKFNIPQLGIITYKITDVATNIGMQMELYNADKVLVPNSHIGGNDGQNYTGEVKVCEGGLYYIKLYDNEGRFNGPRPNPQLYTLTLGIDTADKYECNNEYNTAKTIRTCDTIEGTIRSIGDIDYYKFNVPSSGIVKIRLLEVPSNIDMQMGIATAAQTTVENIIYANVGQGASADITLPSSGDYYFVLFDRNNNASSPNKYKIILDKACSSTGLYDVANTHFDITPNPTTGDISVTNTEGAIQTLKITNLTGQTLLQKIVNDKQAEIDVSTLAKGLYLLSVETTDGRRGVQKFVRN